MNTNTKQVIFRLSNDKSILLDAKLKAIGIKRQQFLERAVDDFLDFSHANVHQHLLSDDNFILQLATKVKKVANERG